jgi:secondary thiamine-phosphate synthase enzyme
VVTGTEVTETRSVPLIQNLVDLIVHHVAIKVSTPAPGFIDITDRVADLVKETGADLGFAMLFSKHTTAAVVIQEKEPGLMEDFARFQDRLAPKDVYYRHDDFAVRTVNMNPDEPENGHSHCMHLVLGSSTCIPIARGALDLGKWQRIFLVELDSPRPREVILQVYGLVGVKGRSTVEASSG